LQRLYLYEVRSTSILLLTKLVRWATLCLPWSFSSGGRKQALETENGAYLLPAVAPRNATGAILQPVFPCLSLPILFRPTSTIATNNLHLHHHGFMDSCHVPGGLCSVEQCAVRSRPHACVHADTETERNLQYFVQVHPSWISPMLDLRAAITFEACRSVKSQSAACFPSSVSDDSNELLHSSTIKGPSDCSHSTVNRPSAVHWVH
jgi:hypothetical protein